MSDLECESTRPRSEAKTWVAGGNLETDSSKTTTLLQTVTQSAKAEDKLFTNGKSFYDFTGAILIFYDKGELSGVYCLGNLPIVVPLGRACVDASSGIRLDYDLCSRKHAEISGRFGGKIKTLKWYITDLKSTHGTAVNDGKLSGDTPTELEDADELVFGGDPCLRLVFKEPSSDRDRRDLHQLVTGKVKQPDADLERDAKRIKTGNPRSVRCRHILLKHDESRRPYDSFRKKEVTRSLEEAKTGMKEIRRIATAAPDVFGKLAYERSECSSARNGGDLGRFERHKMQKAFSDSAFDLEVGEISELVYSDSGIHIILRVE